MANESEEQLYLEIKDVWPDSDADGLRDWIRGQWPQLADALDRECNMTHE